MWVPGPNSQWEGVAPTLQLNLPRQYKRPPRGRPLLCERRAQRLAAIAASLAAIEGALAASEPATALALLMLSIGTDDAPIALEALVSGRWWRRRGWS